MCIYHWVEQSLKKKKKERVSLLFRYSAEPMSDEFQHKVVIFWNWRGLPNQGLAVNILLSIV